MESSRSTFSKLDIDPASPSLPPTLLAVAAAAVPDPAVPAAVAVDRLHNEVQGPCLLSAGAFFMPFALIRKQPPANLPVPPVSAHNLSAFYVVLLLL